MYMYSVGHPLCLLCKGFHTPSPKRRSTPLIMINFTSHTVFHWLRGALFDTVHTQMNLLPRNLAFLEIFHSCRGARIMDKL